MKKISLVLVLIFLVTFSLAGCKPAPKEEKKEENKPATLVISTWGLNEDKIKKNVYEPFEKKYNVKIVLEVGNNGDRLNKIKLGNQSGVDLIYLSDYFAMQGIEEGLFEKIDEKNIPNINNLYDIAKKPLGEGYGPAYTIGRFGIIYDSSITSKPVESWADLWRSEFKNKLSMPDATTTQGPMIITMAGEQAGTTAKDDLDKTFAKLKELNPSVVKYYTKSSEIVNMFNQGEIGIAPALDFVYASVKKSIPKAQWVDPKEGSFAVINTINIVKGTKNKELAEKFIDWALSEEAQKANALDKVESPANKNVKLTAEEAEGLTYGDELIKNLKLVDWKYVNSVNKSWIEKWNKEISASK